ncbi:hypothetical protein OYT88_03675 [Sporolactobacillus sp. CQH2019]|uniref:hypothetical protein n=1 Tax=Sporolactobacillus sp. CQH2019 TaxID=3023512 RepID=UPI002368E861|nr:hypothetical protein [Sporolactobacillus sp. CQH2019]MDD9147650.1 hypothetical protein [Sporolactobacillus sp. CQH2019]
MKKPNTPGRQKGSVLLVVLLVIAVFSIMGLFLISVSFSHMRQIGLEISRTQATNAAEMGLKAYNQKINEELKTINRNVPGTFEAFKTALDSALPDSLNSSGDQDIRSMQGNPEYEVAIGNEHAGDNQIQLTVTSTGTVQGEKRIIAQEKIFKYGSDSSGGSSGGDSDRTPEYMGLSLPYMEGSLIHQGNYYCHTNDNVFINGSSANCVGDTKQTVDFSAIQSLFQDMPLVAPPSSPIAGAPTISGNDVTQPLFEGAVNFSNQLNIQSINTPSVFDGDVHVDGQLNIENPSTFNGDVYTSGQMNIKEDTVFNGNVLINGQLNVEQGVTVTFNGYVRINQQVNLKKDSDATFMKNTYINGQGNDTGKATYVGNVYFGGDLNSEGGDTYQGYVFINGSNNRSDDSAGWNESVNFERTVYVMNNFYPKSNKSAIHFDQGVVIGGNSSPQTSANGLITIGPQQRGGGTVPAPATVATSNTSYQ